jgi:hypothetical protein
MWPRNAFIGEFMEHRSKWAFLLSGVAVCCSWFLAAPAFPAGIMIFKWIDSEGVTVYSQTRPDDSYAREVRTIDVEMLSAEQQQAARRMLAHLQGQANDQNAEYQHRLDVVDKRIEAAIRALEAAEAELRAGSLPTGDDRIGNAGGRARLRESYFDRVAELQTKVDQARRALEEAYASRNAP